MGLIADYAQEPEVQEEVQEVVGIAEAPAEAQA